MNKNTSLHERATYDDEIDLKELFGVLWKAKILIIMITSFFALSSVLYSLSLPDYYKSEAVLSVAGGSNLAALYLDLEALHQWQELICRQVVKIKA